MAKVVRWIIVGSLVLTFLFVVAAGVAYWLIDLDKVVAEQLAKQKPAIEEQVGRDVSWGAIKTSFLPTLGGRVEAITIGPARNQTADTEPLLRLDAVKFELGLWDAITSLGKKVTVDVIAVDGFAVKVTRAPDGTLSYQDILDHRAALAAKEPAPAPEAPAKPLDPQVLEYIRGVSIGELRITGGTIQFVDRMTTTGQPADATIRDLDVRLRDVRLADPIKLEVTAAVFDAAKNFEFRVTAGPLPQDLEFKGIPAVSDVVLKAKGIDLSKVTPYLPKSVPVRIESATFDADVSVPKVALEGPMRVKADVGVAKLRVSGGKQFDFKLATDVETDLAALSLDIAALKVAIGSVALEASGKLRNLAKHPEFSNFKLVSTSLDPSVLLSYYPPAAKNLPEGTKVAGDIGLDLVANGSADVQSIKGAVDLTKLELAYPGAIEKPAGTPFTLAVDGTFTSEDADIKRFGLVLDVVDLALAGTVKKFSDPTLDLTLAAKPFAFDRVVRLVPGMAGKLAAKGIEAKGNGRIDGHVKGTMKDLDAAFDVALTALDLEVPGTTAKGDVTLHAEATGDPSAALTASLALDADGATLVIPDTLAKPAKTPLHLTAAIARNGQQMDVKSFDLQLANLAVAAKGLLDLGAGKTDLAVTLKPFELAPLIKVVPALDTTYTKKGRVDAEIEVKGDPNDLAKLSITLPRFTAQLGKSDFKGTFAVTNLDTLAMTGDITSTLVDADELYFDVPDEPAPAGADGKPLPEAPPEDKPARRKFDIQMALTAKTLKAYHEDFADFRGRLRIKDGVLYVDESSFKMFGGTIDAGGTAITFWKARKPFSAKLAVKNVQVDAALTSLTQYAKVLDGKGDFEIALDGNGFSLANLEEALSGKIDLTMIAGRLLKGDVLKSITAPLAQFKEIPGVKTQAVGGSGALKELRANLVVENGQLRLQKPVDVDLDGHKLHLEGGVGIAGTLAMKGEYALEPAVVKQMTGGRCTPAAPFPVPVTIGGNVKAPDVKPDLSRAGQQFFDLCVKGAALDAIKQQTGIDAEKLAAEAAAKKAELEKAAKEAEEKARAEAERVKAEAEAKAREEAAKLKAEAERIKAEATAKAQAEAARLKAEAEAKARAEAARIKAEAEAKAKAAIAAEKKRLEEEAKKKALELFGPKPK